MVPADKFAPGNICKYEEFIRYVMAINHSVLIFTDEKSLKGRELCNMQYCVDPLTGIFPDSIVPSDFRNTYCVMGMVSVDVRKSTPMVYTIGTDNHDSFSFRQFLENSILTGWLMPDDIIICDNAQIHQYGYNNDLGEFLWNSPGLDGRPLRILLLPLPTRSPELNPIELIWNTLVKRLKMFKSLDRGNHAVARYADYVLGKIEHSLVKKTYIHCGYTNLY